MSQAVVKGSLGSVARQQNLSLAESFLSAEVIVLVDTSASMQAEDAPGGQSRYRAACNELAKLQAGRPGKIAVVSWSSTVEFAPSGIPRFLNAMTALAQALDFVLAADGCGIEIVVISDGEPDDENKALGVARQFRSKIHTIYIGPETGPGRLFLAQLAAISGGQSAAQSAHELNLLSETVSNLLSA